MATSLFDGEDVVGPKTEMYTVPSLDAGTYYFHCDTHPSMSGSVKVAAEPAPSGGEGGSPGPTETPGPTKTPSGGGGQPAEASISATALAFTTATLSFPADTPVSLTFDNQDAGVTHNVAIYQDQGYTQPKFNGEIVTGPTSVTYDVPPLAAGTYYFKCDVHPTMAGTVSVT
jgi:plastocyanin